MKYLLILLSCVLLPSVAMGQRGVLQERPDWVDGFFTERDRSYIEVVSAVGYSEEDARNKAIRTVVERRSPATGQRAQISVRNGHILVDGDDALTVKSRIVDEYPERLGTGEYRMNLLVQTAKNPEFSLEPVTVTDRYRFSPRVFVPGMAQLHKGQTVRGILFIAGEAAAIGGIVAFEGLRSSYASKIGRTHDATALRNYIDKADNMRNIRNGFIAGAAAIYVWNVIDGIVAKGKKHVVIGNTSMALVPYATPTVSGLALNIHF